MVMSGSIFTMILVIGTEEGRVRIVALLSSQSIFMLISRSSLNHSALFLHLLLKSSCSLLLHLRFKLILGTQQGYSRLLEISVFNLHVYVSPFGYSLQVLHAPFPSFAFSCSHKSLVSFLLSLCRCSSYTSSRCEAHEDVDLTDHSGYAIVQKCMSPFLTAHSWLCHQNHSRPLLYRPVDVAVFASLLF